MTGRDVWYTVFMTTSRNISIYVGMALTTAPPEFRDIFQKELKEKLRLLPGVTVLDFYWVAHSELGGADVEVYEWDKTQTEQADLFVAIMDYPSIGLGQEIMIRHNTKKPALYFAHTETKISRMFLGFLEAEGSSLLRYQTADDIVEAVRQNIGQSS